MAAIKMTFSLDESTARRLDQTAERLGKPKSLVVREAIRDYSLRVDRLSEVERLQMLESFDELTAKIPSRPVAEVDRELRQIREARRRGGRGARADARE
jgi:predicted DNA-binding protein